MDKVTERDSKKTISMDKHIRNAYLRPSDVKKSIRRHKVKFVPDSHSKTELETRINDALNSLEVDYINSNFKLINIDILSKNNELSSNVPIYYYAIITYEYDEELK